MLDIRSVGVESADFPPKLRDLPAMPRRLYYCGSLPGGGPSAAIIGARRCSAYGRHQAALFARVLALNGISIISGMARGIDSCAQTAALEAGGRSYAVLGCGVDVCYPPTSRELYQRLPARGGILSEFDPGTQPIAWHFPARNRIISGLADIVLVIEARPGSGSLITANFALEQGRTVYALPGRVTDAYSEGCNQLIAQGASVALSPDVILEELRRRSPVWPGKASGERTGASFGPDHGTPPGNPEKTAGTPVLSEEAVRMLKVMSDDPQSLGDIVGHLDIDPADGASAAAELLMAGLIEENAFHFYTRA